MSTPVSINFEARLRKIRNKMEEEEIDVIVGTRLKTLGYVSGAFYLIVSILLGYLIFKFMGKKVVVQAR